MAWPAQAAHAATLTNNRLANLAINVNNAGCPRHADAGICGQHVVLRELSAIRCRGSAVHIQILIHNLQKTGFPCDRFFQTGSYPLLPLF